MLTPEKLSRRLTASSRRAFASESAVFAWVEPAINRGDLVGDLAFILLVVLVSNVVSNVPLVLVALGWVPQMTDPTQGYVFLAVASTLAGTLTPFGSVANIIVMEAAGVRGEIGFWRFLRYGSVLTIVNLILAFAILYVEKVTGVTGWLGL